MEKLLVVDGSNLLFQMFYGMPARIVGRQGKAIQGTLGFVGALLKVLRMTEPTHAVVLFDGECENPRRQMDAQYKANRPDYSQTALQDTPFSQLEDIYAALKCMGIPFEETTQWEADDGIAAYAKTCGSAMQVVILSQDSDFFQLIGPQISVLRYRGRQSVLWDEAYLMEKLGIAPWQYAACKALTGDTADNIPGLPGVGPKTAAALLRQFGDLDSLLQRAGEIPKPTVRRAVLENRQRIQTNHALIRLTGAVQLPFPVEQLLWQDTGWTTTAVLRAIGLRE